MSPRHHPGEDTLIAYAAGTLGAGPSLVVAVHLDGCRQCGVLVASLEAAGGVLMAQLPPADMSPQALARAMAAIARPLPMGDLPPNGRTAGRSLAFAAPAAGALALAGTGHALEPGGCSGRPARQGGIAARTRRSFAARAWPQWRRIHSGLGGSYYGWRHPVWQR